MNTQNSKHIPRALAVSAAIGGFLSFSGLDSMSKFMSQWYSFIVISTYLRIFSSVAIITALATQSAFQFAMRKHSGNNTHSSEHPLHLFAMRHPFSHLIRGILIVIISLSFTHGFSHLSLSTGYAIIFMLPMCTAICGSLFLKEHISRTSAAAILCGFIGIIIVIRPGIAPLSWGYFSFFVGILTEAPFFIITRRYHRHAHPLNVMLYASILATTLVLIISATFGVSLTLASPIHLLYFAISSVLYIIAQILIIFSLSHLTAHTSIAMQYTQIIWGALFGWWFFGDVTSLNPRFIFGALVVIVSSYTVAVKTIPFARLFSRLLKRTR